ncbi:MerR family transcriptional regulator [Clostridioides difficile]
MYTVGQVSKFLGMSRDTLKFYEEKGLVNPKKNVENGYREYNQFDIYDITTINFYREIDIEIKKIQEIRKSKSIDDLELLLEYKEQVILDEIKYKKILLKKIRLLKEDCDKVKQYFGKYTIKEMRPLRVEGEIKNITAYDEYEILRKHTDNLKEAVTLTALRRVIWINEEGILGNKFIIVREVENFDENIKDEVLTHPNCIYTIIEDGRWSTGGENIDDKVEDILRKIAIENGYNLLGIVYVNILLTTYEEGIERVFLEIYAPIK